ncbi:LysR family transcriptional regulator [Pokkaliibacter sp. MBI-7]|uniref:LysR family transcriptional regulator n=1 Tax=Pokkaliibacter sp. MBI-7 TaxID=3040600 RepID=UPI00244D1286|nr:LysR family transcriptional regulator [Pokkaliibacter sp. MBI-7]MDH2431438.1 LysR family transcriptional regulator [Pokkaliibacter sp. MBI-7]
MSHPYEFFSRIMRTQALPSLKALQAFEAVARHGSFSRAAEELFVSQGAISKQIRSLESHFQLSLFHRGAQVSLTPAGARLFDQLSGAFSQIQQACQSMVPTGKLAIKVPMTFADRWFIPLLRQCEQETGLRLNVTSAWQYDIDFRREQFDMAIIFNDVPGGDHSVYTETLICVKSPHYPGPRPGESTADWLAHAHLISPSRIFNDWDRYLDALSLPRAIVQQASMIATDSMLSAIQAASHGQGLAVVDKLFVQEELQNGRLEQIDPTEVQPGGHYQLCFASHWKGTRELDSLYRWMVETLERQTGQPAQEKRQR